MDKKSATAGIVAILPNFCNTCLIATAGNIVLAQLIVDKSEVTVACLRCGQETIVYFDNNLDEWRMAPTEAEINQDFV